MDIGRQDLIPHHGPIHSPVYRDVQSQVLHHVQRVAQGLFHHLVPCHGADAQQVDLRVGCGQHQGDGVIVAHIAVQNHLDLFAHRIEPPLFMQYNMYVQSYFAVFRQK